MKNDNLFEHLPDEIILNIANHVSAKNAQNAFTLTCHRFHRIAQETRLADRLLLATIRHEQTLISQLLSAYPYLILKQGTALDDADRPIHCTPLEYAINVKNWYIARDLINHLQTLELSQEDERYIEKLRKSIDSNSASASEYQLMYCEYLKHCINPVNGYDKSAWTEQERRKIIQQMNELDPDKYTVKLRNAYIDYIDNLKNFSPEQREIAKQKIKLLETEQKTKGFYDIIPIVEAYHRYMERYRYPFSTAEGYKNFWWHGIGFLQYRMPRFYIDQLCYPDRMFYPTPRFDEASPPPPAKIEDDLVFATHMHPFLGVYFTLFRGLYDQAQPPRSNHSNVSSGAFNIGPGSELIVDGDLRGFVALFQTGARKLLELKELLMAKPEPLVKVSV